MLLRNSTEDHGLLENFDILLERCSSRLEYEFKHLIATSGFDDSDGYTIKKNSSHNDGSDKHTQVALPITNFDIIVDTLSEEAYASARRNFIDESIARLGVHAHMTEMFKSASWEELETHIMRWIPATRVVSFDMYDALTDVLRVLDEAFHHEVQSQWVLVEKQQAVDLSTMVQELVIPVYRNTVGMLQATGAGADSYLQPEDVKLQIEQLFRAMVKS
ncbi:hypothetical protein PR202_ga09182 [Eleusine coracana subsp. coracana]|uniref:Exocyst subunit Exo70 family protein n=1 Tax=Eleusine coracana subsp. coracana TaxID=191504 RepID=A0AAV5C442_ELECO|nr:hypothetical protein PR202_ga09182 [Eleusine coracana subsp. coracana]